MMLALKTDQPEAEVCLISDGVLVTQYKWQAHRQLSVTLLDVVDSKLEQSGKSLQNLSGIIVYEGPGSFTGLRIGITFANSLSYSLKIPIVGSTSVDWLMRGVEALKDRSGGDYVQPLYGSLPTITKQKK